MSSCEYARGLKVNDKSVNLQIYPTIVLNKKIKINKILKQWNLVKNN